MVKPLVRIATPKEIERFRDLMPRTAEKILLKEGLVLENLVHFLLHTHECCPMPEYNDHIYRTSIHTNKDGHGILTHRGFENGLIALAALTNEYLKSYRGPYTFLTYPHAFNKVEKVIRLLTGYYIVTDKNN